MGQEDVIARRYARGLAEHAAEKDEVPLVRRDIKMLTEILDPFTGDVMVPEFVRLLEAPNVDVADKLTATANILAKLGIGKTASDFMAVLIRHNRVGLMQRIAQAFAVFAGELTGEHTAVVHTARALTEDQAARLARVLSNVLGGVVHLHQRIEPGLLAGAKITVGDRTFDGSVLGKLDQLKNRLATRGVNEILESVRPTDNAAS